VRREDDSDKSEPKPRMVIVDSVMEEDVGSIMVEMQCVYGDEEVKVMRVKKKK
jgi:hypothetical protein